MLKAFKLFLTCALFLLCLWAFHAFAEEEREEDKNSALKNPVIIELFSSQVCMFCPEADALFAELIGQENVIGLACHVDYFDAPEGSLAQPFCTQRQTDYVQAIGTGPHYTPQMVVNGKYDVIGYKKDKVLQTLEKASYHPLQNIQVTQDGGTSYRLTLPETDLNSRKADIFAIAYNKPQSITLSAGPNRGKNMTYYNIASDVQKIEDWGGQELEMGFVLDLEESQEGFLIVIQDQDTKEILGFTRL